QGRGSAVQDGLGGGDDDDDVGLDECRMDAKRNAGVVVELDEVVAFDVVDLYVTVEPTGKLVRHQVSDELVSGSPRETARNEEGLIAACAAEPLELLDRGGHRL